MELTHLQMSFAPQPEMICCCSVFLQESMLVPHQPSPPEVPCGRQTDSWVLSIPPWVPKAHHSTLTGSALPKEVRDLVPLLLSPALSAQNRGFMEAVSSGGFESWSRRGWDCETIHREGGMGGPGGQRDYFLLWRNPTCICIAPGSLLILKHFGPASHFCAWSLPSIATPCQQVCEFQHLILFWVLFTVESFF